jgi:cytochrome oxidase Cu insertion factor (SCO1/SenC/PrrC family)
VGRLPRGAGHRGIASDQRGRDGPVDEDRELGGDDGDRHEDPTADTPEVLQRYAAGFGADPGIWDFLTGQPEEVARVVREMGVFTEGDRRLGHTDLVLFVNPRGEVVQRSTGGALGPSQVLDRVRRLLG